MAEGILFAAAQLIIETLGSTAVKEIGLLYGAGDELDKLQRTLSAIKAVLIDAEKKKSRNNQVKDWLDKLEDVVSEADDLLDEVATEGLIRRHVKKNKISTKVRDFFSSSNQIVLRHSMAHRIKDIRERVDEIAADSERFHLEVASDEAAVVKVAGRERETHSYVVEEDVVGREEDKSTVVDLLLKPQNQRLCVVPIVGMGGLGKTTLAQLVFNDERVQNHFGLRIWVSVSDNFDEKLLIAKIVECITSSSTNGYSMENLRTTLLEKINGKRYFLVLDDVWNENYQKWQGLKGLLENCGDESRILVTTRSTMVANITGTTKPYHLGTLDPKKSWSLFKRMAFKHGREPGDPTIVGVAREIVGKCGGVPLAINMIGSLLYFRGQEIDFRYFNEEILSIVDREENDVLATLRLSYDYLPSHLKNCFSFCGLFPKDYEFDVRTLVIQWVAQGLIIKQTDRRRSLEEIGYEYFMELFWRSFFQEVERDAMSNTLRKCKMHDLIHDLALQVARKRFTTTTNLGEEGHFANLHHLSFTFPCDSTKERLSSLLSAKKLRTVLFRSTTSLNASKEIAGEEICDALFSNLRFLRMLDLCNLGIKVVPNSIEKLKHLRYLDLSRNKKIETLPDSITKLVNLQTLKLNDCSNLRELPRGIDNLVSLRHLEFHSWKTNVSHMPRGIGKLTKLQTLSCFVLSKELVVASRGAKLDELMGLVNLRGRLEIKGLRSGVETERREYFLRGKECLDSLLLEWSCLEFDGGEPEKTLDCLEPNRSLKELSVGKYEGFRFSDWLSSLTNLVKLRLDKCSECQRLPSLDQCRFLKTMRFEQCKALKYVTTEVLSDDHHVPTFQSLEQLELLELFNFKGWFNNIDVDQVSKSKSYFPSLTKLTIRNCPKLISMPLYPNVKELELSETTRKPFEQTVSMTISTTSPQVSSLAPLSQVKHLIIYVRGETGIQCFPHWMKCLSSLESLDIYWSRELYPSQGVEFHTSRLVWQIEDSDHKPFIENNTTWESFTRLSHLYCEGLPKLRYLSPNIHCLTSLKKLHIRDCTNLEFALSDNPLKFEAFQSLRTLVFFMVSELVYLPSWIRYVANLQELQLEHCYNLAAIPSWTSELNSLQQLEIIDCPMIKSLPQSIESLVSLQSLLIQGCPALLERCQSPNGEDWPKIKHIANLKLKFN